MTLQLPAYNAARHHIGLARDGQAKIGLMLTGQRRKVLQRAEEMPEAFGGRPPTVPPLVRPATPPSPPSPQAPPVPPSQEGFPPSGPNELITEGGYTWTQEDFSGGVYQKDWSDGDPAMFDSSQFVMPAPYSRRLGVCPPIIWVGSAGLGTSERFQRPILVFAAEGRIIAVLRGSAGGTPNAYLAWWQMSNDTEGATAVDDAGNPLGHITAAAYHPGEKMLYLCFTADGYGITRRYNVPQLTLATTNKLNWPTNPGPATQEFNPVFATFHGEKSLIAICSDFGYGDSSPIQGAGMKVYLGVMPQDTSAGSAAITWTYLGDMMGTPMAYAAYNGFAYILTSNLDHGTSIVAIDTGSATITPVVNVPHNFQGSAMCVHGGRLYVGGHGTTMAGSLQNGELYEVTGTSLRQVRTFDGAAIQGMCSHEGLLWLGDGASQLIAYDITTDSFYEAAGWKSGLTTGFLSHLISARSALWAWSYGSGANGGWVRVSQGSDSPGTYEWQFVSSSFAPRIDKLKIWQRIAILTVGTLSQNITVEYWNGSSYTSIGTGVGSASSGGKRIYEFSLAGVPMSQSLQFRIRTSFTTNAPSFELEKFTVSYKFEPIDVPVNTVAPTIIYASSLLEGTTAWVNEGTWTGEVNRYEVQWQRSPPGGGSWNDIPGARYRNYTFTRDDVGYIIRATVRAINSGGSSGWVNSNATGTILIYTAATRPPQAEFTASVVAGRDPLTVSFADLSDYDRATSWAWTFGDGGTSTAQHPFHTYTTPGTYNVQLTATNSAGSSVKLKTGYILVEPELPDKKAWQFTIAGLERFEADDGSVELYNVDLLRDTLWDWINNEYSLDLADADGEANDVKLVGLEEHQPVILPNIEIADVNSTDITTTREAFFTVTLLQDI